MENKDKIQEFREQLLRKKIDWLIEIVAKLQQRIIKLEEKGQRL